MNRLVVGVGIAVVLGASSVAMASGGHRLTTTASTAGTTAYIVGKHVHDNNFAAAHRFAHSQAAALRREAAVGGGEDLDSLAALLGESDAKAFGRWMQSHYAKLYKPSAPKSNLVDRIVALKPA